MCSRQRDDVRPEYPPEPIRSGVRGKYAERYQEGADVAPIDPELHERDPDSEAVDRALREHLAQHSAPG